MFANTPVDIAVYVGAGIGVLLTLGISMFIDFRKKD